MRSGRRVFCVFESFLGNVLASGGGLDLRAVFCLIGLVFIFFVGPGRGF